ncbi:hypothetical protein AB1Y20_022246 [Prymnesium parvum]|uniref:Reverse transcriptase RNase H-like domain-containing protein n=1 Tax=Prymnesium parvum TaxID=97485 RepID=A0AB34JHE6_PRYPA
MPRLLLATDAEGNARVVTIPSPTHDSVGVESESAGAATQHPVEEVSDTVVAEQEVQADPDGATGVEDVNEGDTTHAQANTSVGRVNTPGDQLAVEVEVEPEVNASNIMVTTVGVHGDDSEVQRSDGQEHDDGEQEESAILATVCSHMYWEARGFSPLVALALEDCCVSPTMVESGAPMDEMGVLATTRSFFGQRSAAVTSWVAAAYSRNVAARVVQTTRSAAEEAGKADTSASRHVLSCYAREQATWQDELMRHGRWEAERGTAVAGVPDSYVHGNDDVKKAFRRIPNAAVGLMVVGVLNPLSLRAEFFVLPSFVFGSISAVMSWNRVPAAYTHFARRLLAVPSTAYVDDFQVGGPWYDQGSSQQSQSDMLDIIGLGFDASKHEDGTRTSVNLGVESDFSLVSSLAPAVLLGVTNERKAKLAVVVEEILCAGVISHALALRLYGKARWTVCPVFGKIGLGVLHRLPSVHRTESVEEDTMLGDDLRTLLRMIPMLRPVSFPLFVRRDAPLLVWTDASEDATLLGEIGVVVWCPVRSRAYAAGSRAPHTLLAWLRSKHLKKKYITQWELFAVLVAFLTFPELFQFRLVHHFVDNKGALGGLIKGYSDKPDSARIINMVHTQAVRFSCYPWFGFVYSEDNIADGPSHGDFSDVDKLGAAVTQLVWPDLQVLAGWSVGNGVSGALL